MVHQVMLSSQYHPSVLGPTSVTYSRKFRWLVGGGCFVKKGEELLSSIDGAKEVKVGRVHAPVVDVGLVVSPQEEWAVENYVCKRALFRAALTNSINGLVLPVEASRN